ncbi:DUF952 domain-containing protein [Palleronia sp. LCG004]|uniref:DUF952 domain-containing protein n=1 Tax=Palleronia sp. LCG004 TaxID=3079304 RepID=UPI002943969E|nr:DUF952 domain-containing protein [Palleronia sp. LCG004]WOI56615.1 DUF952 domain-containing protein [Palleronia sp. LCG004]
MEIYKILRPQEFAEFERAGETRGAPVDLDDGYIHLSKADQLEGTLAKHFTDAEEVILCACDAGRLGTALKWEAARGGDLFPHLYRNLERADILWNARLTRGDDGFTLPDRVG